MFEVDVERECGVLARSKSVEFGEYRATTIHILQTDHSSSGLIEAHALALDGRLRPSVD